MGRLQDLSCSIGLSVWQLRKKHIQKTRETEMRILRLTSRLKYQINKNIWSKIEIVLIEDKRDRIT